MDAEPFAWSYTRKNGSEHFVQPNRANMDPRCWIETPVTEGHELIVDLERVIETYPSTRTANAVARAIERLIELEAYRASIIADTLDDLK